VSQRTLFTFETTHHALWSEELAVAAGLACELVPAPAAANARCNLALETLEEEVEQLRQLLTREGVLFQVFIGAA
jgi:hypothetical protein